MRSTKHLILAALFLFICTVGAYAQKSAVGAKADLSKPVREAFDRLLDGIRQVDANKVMDAYEKSPRTLFFNNNGSVTLGWDQMKTNRESSYARTKDVTLEVTGVRVEMLGRTAAYVSCKWKQSQIFGEKLEDASRRMTLIFKLIGKEWKVVHLHTSPDNPPANRPVLDSERTEKPTN